MPITKLIAARTIMSRLRADRLSAQVRGVALTGFDAGIGGGANKGGDGVLISVRTRRRYAADTTRPATALNTTATMAMKRTCPSHITRHYSSTTAASLCWLTLSPSLLRKPENVSVETIVKIPSATNAE